MSTTIESVLHENRVFDPSPAFVAQANVSGMDAYKALCAEAEADYEGYWGKLARENVVWKQPFTTVLDESNAPFYKWFPDGKLNVSYNCLDKNVEAGLGDKTAIIFEADKGEVTKVTYKELLARVCKFANALKSLGVKKGDRVDHLPAHVHRRAWWPCRPAPASAPPTRWSSAASPPSPCATASRTPARC
jgi:acetyl-CoA synthetase